MTRLSLEHKGLTSGSTHSSSPPAGLACPQTFWNSQDTGGSWLANLSHSQPYCCPSQEGTGLRKTGLDLIWWRDQSTAIPVAGPRWPSRETPHQEGLQTAPPLGIKSATPTRPVPQGDLQSVYMTADSRKLLEITAPHTPQVQESLGPQYSPVPAHGKATSSAGWQHREARSVWKAVLKAWSCVSFQAIGPKLSTNWCVHATPRLTRGRRLLT